MKIGRKTAFSKRGRNGSFTEGRKEGEEEEGEECHFTIWNACIQIEGGSFAPRRMRLYLHCHTPSATHPAWITGKDTLANPIVELRSSIKVPERWI